MSYSFDVKIDGKPVVRNTDVFTGNDRNTPPGPIMQSQPAPVVVMSTEKEEKEKCPYCDKDEHDFAKKPGQHVGMSGSLSRRIFKGWDKEAHPWYSGLRSLAAHHIICSEAMSVETNPDWKDYCYQFGYDINHKNNGVMLPMKMDLACQIHAPLHLSNHSSGQTNVLNMSYPDAVNKKIDKIADDIEDGKFCSDPGSLIKKLNKISLEILGYINDYSWTITSDGKDYQSGQNGCGGVKNIPDKKGCTCPHQRTHDIKQHQTKKLIPVKTLDLKVGE